MKALRTFLVVAAVALMLTGASTKANAVDPSTDTCVADGSADTGNDALSVDLDTQLADSANEADNTNSVGETTIDTANDQCGPDENRDKQSDVAGTGTNNNIDDKDNEN